jgi:CRP-like cAMP-binding protein
MSINRLICKLEQFAPLSNEQRKKLGGLVRRVADFGPGEEIIRQGDRPDDVHLVLEGWAARYKILPEGERHIMAYLIPGDMCDVLVRLLPQMDHSIGALSRCKVGFIPSKEIFSLIEEDRTLARALLWADLVGEAILREWLVTRVRRAEKRLAHLFCEMLLRSKAVGLTDDDGFELPLTQEELGDTMGLSTVHINRTMQELRGKNLIASKGKRMIINDLDGLKKLADFDGAYLHQLADQGSRNAAAAARGRSD